jgi:Carboxypeptidase regulatory-like domain
MIASIAFEIIALLLFQTSYGSIEGIVSNAGSGEPLSKALVELVPADNDASTPDVATTSPDGKFTFRNIQPGRYRLSAARAGYVQVDYKRILTVSPGRQVTDIRFALPQTGTIYGRIIDRSGQPLANATVRAMKNSYSYGQRSLKTEQTAITNDLGEYRLFWLSPGSYFVSVLPYTSGHPFGEMLTSGVDPKNDSLGGIGTRSIAGLQGVEVRGKVSSILNKTVGSSGPNEIYVSTYFPGTMDRERASPVRVRSADEVGGVDITVAPIETHHIRGVIMNGITRKPASGPQLRKARASAVDVCASTGMNAENCSFVIVDYENGSFDIPQVTSGSYLLYAIQNDLVAQAFVEVGNSDIDNIVLTLQPGITITGKVVPAVAGVEVRLTPGPPIPGRSLAGSSLRDGMFSVRGVTPGDYRVRISGLKGTYIKSITAGDKDVLNLGFHVTAPSEPTLEIVLFTSPGTIEGRVLDSLGEPAIRVSVVLIPEPVLLHRTDLYRSAQTDASGRYQLNDIPPADYKLFAWEDVEPGAWQDPAFMRGYEDRGKFVRVTEGSTHAVDVVLIPSAF